MNRLGLMLAISTTTLLVGLGPGLSAETMTAKHIAEQALESNLFSTQNARATLDMPWGKPSLKMRVSEVF